MAAARQDVANAAGFAAAAFSEFLPPEQRATIDAAIASGTLSVHFTTQRDQPPNSTASLVTSDTPPAPESPAAESTMTGLTPNAGS